MSRTIRRKNSPFEHHHVGCDYIKVSGFFYWQEIQLTKKDKKYWKQYWKYHSDNHSGVHNSPGRFRRYLNKLWNSQDKQELIRFLKDPDNYEPVFNPRRNNANWEWF